MSGMPFGQREFSDSEKKEIQSLLESKISAEHLSSRPGAGGSNIQFIFHL